MKQRLGCLIAIVVLAILGVILMRDVWVRQILYPTPRFAVPSPPPAPLEEVWLTLPGGERVLAWWRAGERPDGPVILFSHGNGENLAALGQMGLFEFLGGFGSGVLAIDYPGYGRSEGTPSQASLTAAAEAALEWMQRTYPERPRVVFGFSLGSAVSMQLAARAVGRYDRLVVLAPWDRLQDLASVHFPAWLVRWMLTDPYDSVAAAARIEAPVLLIYGSEDRIVPPPHSQRLATAFPRPPRQVEVVGAGHNDLLGWPEVARELEAFLEARPAAAP